MTREYDRDKQKKVGLSWVRKNIIITTFGESVTYAKTKIRDRAPRSKLKK